MTTPAISTRPNQILTPELPDEVIEAAANMGGTIPTGSVNIIPPNCC